MQFPNSDFWDFSNDFYAHKEIESTCLTLQDKYDLNVNLILFSCWLTINKNSILDKQQWLQLYSATLPWEEIIKPLRQSRRMINHSSIAWPSDFKAETGKTVSTIEINTEHMQQLSIEQTWLQMTLQSSQANAKEIITENIKTYLVVINSDVTINDFTNELDCLLQACVNYQTNKKTMML